MVFSIARNLDSQTPFKTQTKEHSHRSFKEKIFISLK